MRLAPLVGLIAAVLVGAGLFWKINALAIGAALGGFILFVLAMRNDDSRKAVLLYDLDTEAQGAFQRFCAAFDVLLAADRVWHIEAQGKTGDWKRNAGAASLVRRKDRRPLYAAPSSVASNIDVPSFPVGRQTLFFFPDRVLVFEGKTAGAVEYAELRLNARPTNFIEEEGVPRDTQVVGSTWRYVNKSGGPDRRFNNNRQLPICRYDELSLGSGSGLNEMLNVSRPGAAVSFATGTSAYLRELRALASARAPLPQNVLGSAQPALPANLPEKARPWRPALLATLAVVSALFLVSAFWSPRASAPPSQPPAIAGPPATAPEPSGPPSPAPTAVTAIPIPSAKPVGPDIKPADTLAAIPPTPKIEPSEPNIEPAEEPALYTTSRVNMRGGPTASSPSTAVIDKGLKASLLGAEGEWRKVRVGAFEGWVNAKFLSSIKPKQASGTR
jgi:hypothetical protein